MDPRVYIEPNDTGTSISLKGPVASPAAASKNNPHACIYDSDSSLVARTRLASVVTLASARMTPCEYSTPNTALMLVAIRFACFSDQKRKSSAEGWESALVLSTSRLLTSNADAGRRDGSASRQRLMMWSKHERTPTKSNDDGFDTTECGGRVNKTAGHNSVACTITIYLERITSHHNIMLAVVMIPNLTSSHNLSTG